MHLIIGPVDAEAARRWTAHMLTNLETLLPLRQRLPFRLPDEVADRFADLLREWRDHAERCGPTFAWSGDLDEDDVRTLVRYWANLDSLSDDLVAALGLSWSPPEARPFFEALAKATAAALAGEDGGTDPFAEMLAENLRGPSQVVRRPEPSR